MKSVFDDPEEIKDDPEVAKAIKGFCDAFKKLRTEHQYSQNKISEGSGISQKAISEIESGGNFKMSNYVKMCKAAGMIPVVRFQKAKKSNAQRTAPSLR